MVQKILRLMLLRLLINGDGLRKVDSKCGRFLVSGPNERSGTDRTGPIYGPE